MVLKAFPKAFPIEMKPTNCLAKKKEKKRDKISERRGKREGEKAQRKSQDRCVTFKPKTYLEMLLSAHALCSHQATALRDFRKKI